MNGTSAAHSAYPLSVLTSLEDLQPRKRRRWDGARGNLTGFERPLQQYSGSTPPVHRDGWRGKQCSKYGGGEMSASTWASKLGLNRFAHPGLRGTSRGTLAALLGAIALLLFFLVLTVLVWASLVRTVGSGLRYNLTTFELLSVDPGSPAERAGLRTGDRLRSMDGIAISSPAQSSDILAQHHPGDTLVYTLSRAGSPDSTYETNVTLESLLFTSRSRDLLLPTGVGVLTLAVAAAVFFARPGAAAPRLLFLASAAFALALNSLAWQIVVTGARTPEITWLLRVYVVMLVLGPAGLLHLFLVFPQRSPLLTRLESLRRVPPRAGTTTALLALVWILPASLGVVLQETYRLQGLLYPLIFRHQLSLLQPLPGQRDWTGATVFIDVTLLACALVALVQSYLRQSAARVRMQLRWILAALTVLFLSEAWGRGLVVLQGYISGHQVELPAPPGPEMLAWIALPAAVGVAVVRHELFEIRVIVRATLLYAPLTILLVLGYLELAFAMSRAAVAVLGPESAADPTVSVLAALAVAAVAYPLRLRLQQLLERTLYRHDLARREFLNAANEKLGHAQTPDSVAQFLTARTAKLLDLRGAWLTAPAFVGVSEASASMSTQGRSLLHLLPPMLGPTRLINGEPDLAISTDVLDVEGPVLTELFATGVRIVVPLRAESGSSDVLGLWMLGARRSNTRFERADMDAFGRVADRAAVLLENARLQEEQVQQAVIRHELDRAREIQQRLIPKTMAGWPGQLQVAARFRPARQTSGDFYEALSLDSDGGTIAPLLLAVGDVAGKGIGAALVTALAHAALRVAAEPTQVVRGPNAATDCVPVRAGDVLVNEASWVVSPSRVLNRAGSLLHRDLGPRDFVACALIIVEPARSCGRPYPRLWLANAGQVPPLLCRRGHVSELVPDGERWPLGVLAKPAYTELVVGLEPGDVVVVSSDGLPEAPRKSAEGGDSSEMFGFERFTASASGWSDTGKNAEEVAEGIWQDVAAWTDQVSEHDDMTLLVLRVPEPAGAQ